MENHLCWFSSGVSMKKRIYGATMSTQFTLNPHFSCSTITWVIRLDVVIQRHDPFLG